MSSKQTLDLRASEETVDFSVCSFSQGPVACVCSLTVARQSR